VAKKDTDAPEALAARDREPTPEGQRDSAVVEQIALDAGQVPGGVALDDQGQPIIREVTDGVGGQDSPGGSQ
jgi:hypothetical protein